MPSIGKKFIGKKTPVSSASAASALPAFTLMEMIVSLSIIVAVTAFFIADFQSSNKRTDLTMAAQNLVSDFHAAQNNTLGLARYNGLSPKGGWGMHLETGTTTYTMFADLDGPGETGYMRMDEGEADIRYGARTTTLSGGLEILSLKIGPSLTPVGSVNVTFLPPDPQTNISALSGATSTVLRVELKELKSGTVKSVQVNFLGLIETL